MSRVTAIFLALFFIVSFTAAGMSQNANTNPPAAVSSQEVMTENDRIPFMRKDENAQPAAEPGSGNLLLKTIGALILVVSLIFVCAWVVRKTGYGTGKKVLENDVELSVVSSVQLGSDRAISSIRFGERLLLVGVTAQSFTLLAEHDAADTQILSSSRSVADLLADDEQDFNEHFDKATGNLGLWARDGETV